MSTIAHSPHLCNILTERFGERVAEAQSGARRWRTAAPSTVHLVAITGVYNVTDGMNAERTSEITSSLASVLHEVLPCRGGLSRGLFIYDNKSYTFEGDWL